MNKIVGPTYHMNESSQRWMTIISNEQCLLIIVSVAIWYRVQPKVMNLVFEEKLSKNNQKWSTLSHFKASFLLDSRIYWIFFNGQKSFTKFCRKKWIVIFFLINWCENCNVRCNDELNERATKNYAEKNRRTKKS